MLFANDLVAINEKKNHFSEIWNRANTVAAFPKQYRKLFVKLS
jgi:hypothetical protein